MEAVDLIKLGFSGVMGLLTVQVGIQLYFLKRIVDQGGHDNGLVFAEGQPGDSGLIFFASRAAYSFSHPRFLPLFFEGNRRIVSALQCLDQFLFIFDGHGKPCCIDPDL